MASYVLAHDVGTSGNKASIVDINGKIVASTEVAYPVLYPKPGWAEQNPDEHWWNAICTSTNLVVNKSNISRDQIIAVTFSTQMAGTIPVDKNGKPLMNAMIWLDTRAAKQNRDVVSNPIKMLRMLRITGGILLQKISLAKSYG